MLRIHSFSTQCYTVSGDHISTINPANVENTAYLLIKLHDLVSISEKVVTVFS